MLCHLFALIDRTNVGFAKLQFMVDLGLEESEFGFGAGVLNGGSGSLRLAPQTSRQNECRIPIWYENGFTLTPVGPVRFAVV
jgi:hypothetical protein